MIISTVGIELNENVYVNKEGKFLFRIEKFEEDGFTNAGDAKFKLHFKGVEVGTKEPVYLHNEQFNIGQSSLWRIKQVEVALKAPETYDINDFVKRYVITNIKQETYKKNDGSIGTSYKVKSWEYSSFNDKLPPIPEAKSDENNGTNGNSKTPEIEINDEDIPF
jgi:hypothetical protein